MMTACDGSLSLMLLERLCRDMQAQAAARYVPPSPPLAVRYRGLASRATLVLTAVASAMLSLAELTGPFCA